MHDKKFLLFIPAYNCSKQIGRVIGKFDDNSLSSISKVLIIDNRSEDNTLDEIKACLKNHRLRHLCEIYKNDENYGLGGSHKVAFLYATKNNFDYMIVLHGDDQAELSDITPYTDYLTKKNLDGLLGSRFKDLSRLKGYSFIRVAGNLIFNFIFSVLLRRNISDLGSGLNIFKIDALKRINFLNLPDDLTFNYSLTGVMALNSFQNEFVPINWTEEDQTSNVRAIKQVKQILCILWKIFYLGKKFNQIDSHSNLTTYTSQKIKF